MARFSRRNDPVDDPYTYDIPEPVRERLFQAIERCVQESQWNLSIHRIVRQMENKILEQYGGFQASGYRMVRASDDPVVEHFFKCDDEEVLDFLEMLFETQGGCGGQNTVEAINRIFEDAGIGYELTAYVETFKKKKKGSKSGLVEGDLDMEVQLPKGIRKDEKTLHGEVVKPCLAALAGTRFALANAELVAAFDEYRQEKYADAITDAGSAFESVLKIICTEKGWPFDNDKDICSKLLGICNENGLFHGFYKPILEGTATVRNKVGDAHGKGTKAEYPATKELADHMLYMVCNNINLVIGLAGL